MKVILEPPTRFDRSLMWRVSNAWFQRHARAAWTESVVPERATSCRARARSLARVVLPRLGATPGPLHLLDVASGSGRFVRNLVAALRHDLGPEGAEVAARLVVLMSDRSEPTVRAAAEEPELAELIAEGAVRPALFDMLQPDRLVDLAGSPIEGPIDVVFANYAACVLPARIIQAHHAGARELFVETWADVPKGTKPEDLRAAWLSGLQEGSPLAEHTWSWPLADAGDPFWRSKWAAMVSAVSAGPNDVITCPLPFLSFIVGVRALARTGGLLLISDHGITASDPPPENVEERLPRSYGGSLALGVDFRLLAELSAHHGFGHIATDQPLGRLHTAVVCWDGSIPADVATAFDHALVQTDDGELFLDLCAAALQAAEADNPAQEVRLLRAALAIVPDDPELHLRLGKAYLGADHASHALRFLLAAESLDRFDRLDVQFELGRLYGRIGSLDAALAAFEASLAREDHPLTRAYIGLVHERAGRVEEARQACQQALAMSPELPAARAALARLD